MNVEFYTLFEYNSIVNIISIKNCRVENSRAATIKNFSWSMDSGEAWLVIGPNGGGKADFLKALCGQLKIIPNADGLYSNVFDGSVEIPAMAQSRLCSPDDIPAEKRT